MVTVKGEHVLLQKIKSEPKDRVYLQQSSVEQSELTNNYVSRVVWQEHQRGRKRMIWYLGQG